jgi:hypothetical protein
MVGGRLRRVAECCVKVRSSVGSRLRETGWRRCVCCRLSELTLHLVKMERWTLMRDGHISRRRSRQRIRTDRNIFLFMFNETFAGDWVRGPQEALQRKSIAFASDGEGNIHSGVTAMSVSGF